MKNLAIKFINEKTTMRNGIRSLLGEIMIQEMDSVEPFTESFYSPLEYWKKKDYERQWREGLERIRTHDRSCLITKIADPTRGPFVDWWLLYKEDNKIFIQNAILFDEDYRESVGNKPFTIKTCYDFIHPHNTDSGDPEYEISEWIISL